MAVGALRKCHRVYGRLGILLQKFKWGVRTVGPWRTAHGAWQLFLISLQRPENVRVALRSGPVLTMNRQRQLVPALVVFGDVIDPEYALLSAIAQPGWSVIDVGAGIGQFSVFAALLLEANVDAYEPSSANVAMLDRNVSNNGVAGRITIHHEVLADREGTTSFSTASKAFLSRPDRAASGTSETVPARTLDRVIDTRKVDLVKINVAGFEPEVLAGAEQALRAGQVSIIVVLIGVRSLPWYKLLCEWGYRAYFYHPKHRELHAVKEFDSELPPRPPWPARHLIFIHRTAADVLGPVRLVD